MNTFNIKNIEKRWNSYHKLELEYKRHALKKMSKADGFRLFTQLYEFVSNCGLQPRFKKFNENKLRALIRIHNMFNRAG